MKGTLPHSIRCLSKCLKKGEGTFGLFRIPKNRIPCAVLVIIFKRKRQFSLLLTRRSERMGDAHAGQIACAGGHYEKRDRVLLKTALREAREELRLSVRRSDVLGYLSPVETLTGFWILPFVAYFPTKPAVIVSSDEIASSFSVPLSAIGETRRWKSRVISVGGHRRRVEIFLYKRYVIWGATARMLKELGELLVAQG